MKEEEDDEIVATLQKPSLVFVYKQKKASQARICTKKLFCKIILVYLMSRQVSSRQLELLLDFLAQHRGLATGRSVRGKEGRALSKRLWTKCAAILNMEPRGTRKSALDWKKYYNQYKSRIKAKVRIAEGGENGEEPTEPCILTPLEERLYRIIGSFNSSKKCNPLEDNTTPNVMVDQEYDDYDVPMTPSMVSPIINHEVDHKEHVEAHSLQIKRENNSLGNNINHCNEHLEVRNSTAKRDTEGPQTQRRRHSSDRDELRGVEERLASLEQSRIEVEKEMVGAINRQAAATESFVEQVKRFVDLFAMKVKRRRRSSESE